MPIKRPILRYCVLTFLLAISLLYEVPYTIDLFRGEFRNVPFFLMASATNRVSFSSPAARQAGLEAGDSLLAVNGIPYIGTGVLGAAIANAQPGHTIVLTTRSHDPAKTGERTISLPVARSQHALLDIGADLALNFLFPALCLLLGFWVAFVRPRDRMAWLLLALMMAFPHLLETFTETGWPPGWREAGMLYHSALGASFPVVMFLFGRYFPEPFLKGSRHEKMWKILSWALAVPFALLALQATTVSVLQLGDYRSVAALNRLFKPFDGLANAVSFLLIGSFFAATAIKLRNASSDAGRRLRFLYWGTSAAFVPGLVLVLWGLFFGKSVAEIFPQWVIVLGLLPLVLFPLTLAYVIVVQKAMAVGVAVRQGLQYALAKSGVRVLQVASIGVISLAAASLAGDVSRNRVQKIALIAVGLTAVLTIRGIGERLRTWIDRRFFREAYNAEHVLTDLTEQVRSIVEPKPLLEMVAARISETLHVPLVAVLMAGGELYRPAVALGYGNVTGPVFPRNTGMMRVLGRQKEPARVFLSDRDSWLYREQEIFEEDREKLASLQSELLLPLAVRNKLLGFISLGPKKSEEPYTGSDVRLLKSVAAQTGMALENADLMQEIAGEIAHRERLNREVEIAREVQERLFPQKLPLIAGLDYAGHCRPALGVGGDYYDFLALPEGRLGVAIGDVSGKGIAAALMMASLQASLRGEATRAPENLAAAIANVNRMVYEVSPENRYATFFYGQYDPVTGRFDYVNAGHNPPLLFHRRDGQLTIARLDVGGAVVGLLESYPYEQGWVTLAPGDLLVAYTDGISEAMNCSDEEWGEQSMMEVIQGCAGRPSREILELVFAAADAFVAGAKQHDDMTLVILRVAPGI